MGILTHITSDYDDEEQVQRIFATTRFELNSRSALNRVASRAAILTGVGQRTLVASAYDKLGIDLVWRDGPFSTLDPEEKYPKAQKIKFKSQTIEKASNAGDLFGIPQEELPSGKLWDIVAYGTPDETRESIIYMWEIPYEVGGQRR